MLQYPVLQHTLINFEYFTVEEMAPINPVVREGDSLVANCTLQKHYTGSFSAFDLYFKVRELLYNE